jgi:hypothetical protein
MKNIFRTAIFAMALMFCANFAFGQENNNYNGEQESDYLRVSFSNMGNLPQLGTISFGWNGPSGWIYQSIYYTATTNLYIAVVPPYCIEGKVTVDLPLPNGNKYSATKWWSGYGGMVTFTNSDFVLVATIGPGAEPY